MANKTPMPSTTADRIRELFRIVNERIDRISTFDASQLTRAVEKLQQLVDGLLEQVDVNASNDVNAGHNVTAVGRVAAGGSVTAGDDVTATDDVIAGDRVVAGGQVSGASAAFAGAVTAGGLVSTTNANVAGFVFSPGAFGYDITYTRQQVWMGNDGRIAWASSSREKKTDIHDAFTDGWLDPLAVLDISAKMFHYRAELAKRDDPESLEYVGPEYHVAWEFGAIAEELHELGLWQVVVYKDHWKPIGIHYDLLGLLAIEASKFIWRQHLALRADHLELARKVDALAVLAGMDF